MKVKIKKLHEQAKMPFKKHSADAGFDLYATSRVNEGGNIVYGTGLAFEIPEGFVGLVFPRSSIANKTIALSNAVGVIDASYRGERSEERRVGKERKAGRTRLVGYEETRGTTI